MAEALVKITSSELTLIFIVLCRSHFTLFSFYLWAQVQLTPTQVPACPQVTSLMNLEHFPLKPYCSRTLAEHLTLISDLTLLHIRSPLPDQNARPWRTGPRPIHGHYPTAACYRPLNIRAAPQVRSKQPWVSSEHGACAHYQTGGVYSSLMSGEAGEWAPLCIF